MDWCVMRPRVKNRIRQKVGIYDRKLLLKHTAKWSCAGNVIASKWIFFGNNTAQVRQN